MAAIGILSKGGVDLANQRVRDLRYPTTRTGPPKKEGVPDWLQRAVAVAEADRRGRDG